MNVIFALPHIDTKNYIPTYTYDKIL